jgi:cell division protein FtsN
LGVTDSIAVDTANRREPPRISQVEFSVQVAAYTRKRDADAALNRLKARGFAVRVVGARAPFRLRVGRYATRDEAVAAQGRMRRAGVTGMVVEAEDR